MNTPSSPADRLSDIQVQKLLRLGLSTSAAVSAPPPIDNLRDVLGRAGRRQLRQILADLDSPIIVEKDEALSFTRLFAAHRSILAELHNKTFRQALTCPGTSDEALMALRDYGKKLTSLDRSARTQLAGTLIRLLALAGLAQNKRSEPGRSSEADALLPLMETLLTTANAPDSLRDLARTASNVLKEQQRHQQGRLRDV